MGQDDKFDMNSVLVPFIYLTKNLYKKAILKLSIYKTASLTDTQKRTTNKTKK